MKHFGISLIFHNFTIKFSLGICDLRKVGPILLNKQPRPSVSFCISYFLKIALGTRLLNKRSLMTSMIENVKYPV